MLWILLKLLFFSLKRNYANLPTNEYVNLKSYPSEARSFKNIILPDLNVLLRGITVNVSNASGLSETRYENDELSIRDHIAAFWVNKEYEWYLGFVLGVFKAYPCCIFQ